MIIPEWLLEKTFRVEYSPNCPSEFLVRLCQYGKGYIRGTREDAIGFGHTIQEAAEKALAQYDAVRNATMYRHCRMNLRLSETTREGQS